MTMNARDRTEWMSLEGLKAHFGMHPLQAALLDAGLDRRGMDGPSFILMHTGAALRPDGAQARAEILEAIDEKIRLHHEEAESAKAMALRWEEIRDRVDGMTDDGPWKNPLWEREFLKGLRKDMRTMGTGHLSTPRLAKRLAQHKFRRGFPYRDVVCIHQNQYSAFRVDREHMGMLSTLPPEWKALFPEVDFTRQVFRWMVFPKDLSGGTHMAYLQFGNMAFRLAGDGHTRRYDHQNGQWIEGESIESWRS